MSAGEKCDEISALSWRSNWNVFNIPRASLQESLDEKLIKGGMKNRVMFLPHNEIFFNQLKLYVFCNLSIFFRT